MKENLKALDGLRGIAALYVFVHHARLALTQSYQSGLAIHPEKYEWYDKLMVYFLGLFKFGHEAVIIFFVLSGFVIHLKNADKNYRFQNLKIISYFKKRIVRIYPTLLVSLLLCVLIDFLIYHFITDDSSVFSQYTLSSFLYNISLIPNAPFWGNNFPVWSLRHEWLFYLMYPFLLWLSTKNSLLPIIIATCLYVSYFLGFNIPLIGSASCTLLLWTLGCLLAVFYKNSYIITKYTPYLLILCFFYPLINRVGYYPLVDLCFGLITMGFLSVIITAKVQILNMQLIRMAWLGTFSYSLYLLHSPFLNLFKVIILNKEISHQVPYHLWYVVLAILTITPTIYLIYYFTERIAINYKKKSL